MSDKIHLTPQDKKVFECLAAGKTPKTIAGELGIDYAGIYLIVNRVCLRVGLRKTERHKIPEKYKELCNSQLL